MKDKQRESITRTARRLLEQPHTLPELEATSDEAGLDAIGFQVRISSLSVDQLEDLLERKEHILTIQTTDTETTLRQLQSYARESGKAVYLWRPEEGMSSLKVNDMSVPGSTRLADALRYILSSRHYGIYIFVDFHSQLLLDCKQLLREIVKAHPGYERKVILLGQEVELPNGLARVSARIEYKPERHLRLRDGRWIV